MQSAVSSRHPKYRTKLCRNFASGGCPFGQKCSFVHPIPRISPPSASSQRLFNWNPLLLPQLLALSNPQGTRKEMSRRLPPQPQGPELIDEGPSPSTSLLLSKSDCTSSEQMSQTRRHNRRKKQPCKHFVRTGGWCPVAGQCRFHHDVAALASKPTRKVERPPPFAWAHEGGRAINSGVLMGKQVPSPHIVNEPHLKPPCDGAEPVQPPYHSMYWPNNTWQPYPSYYAAMPATAAVPVLVPPPVMQHSVHPPPQPPIQIVRPTEIQTGPPLRSYQMNGTTYFLTSMPSVPAPAPMTYPVPYNPPRAPAYPCYAPPPLPAGYRDIPSGRQTSFDPFASDPMVPSELPVIPRLEDHQISPIQQDDLSLTSPFAPSGDLGPTTHIGKPTVTQEHEFPYQPPTGQRMGHARRISVNIKKHVRANSG